MQITTVAGPSYWASYFVNGDASGLTPQEREQADAWLKREGVDVLDVARDDGGNGIEPRFTWSYRLYAPECGYSGGEVIDYVCRVL